MALMDLQNVSISLPIYNSRGRGLKHEIVRRTVGSNLQHPKDQNITIVRALSDVTLRIKDGDRVGVVGRNGAGKTTLLRVLSRIYPPTAGKSSGCRDGFIDDRSFSRHEFGGHRL